MNVRWKNMSSEAVKKAEGVKSSSRNVVCAGEKWIQVKRYAQGNPFTLGGKKKQLELKAK